MAHLLLSFQLREVELLILQGRRIYRLEELIHALPCQR